MFDKSKNYEDLFSRKLLVHVTRRLSAAAVVKGFENAVAANGGHLPSSLISNRGLVLLNTETLIKCTQNYLMILGQNLEVLSIPICVRFQ